MDGITLTLNSPITEEQWDALDDVDFDHVNEITCCTKHGKVVRFVKEPHWIPVTESLPEYPFWCLVTVWDTDPITMDEFKNILPYFVGWDGEQWNDGDGDQCPFEVIAWMPLPKPYGGDAE